MKPVIVAAIFTFYGPLTQALLSANTSSRSRKDVTRTRTSFCPIRKGQFTLIPSRHNNRPFILSPHHTILSVNRNSDPNGAEDDGEREGNDNEITNSMECSLEKTKKKGRIGPLGGRKRKKLVSSQKERSDGMNWWNIPILLLVLLLVKGVLLDSFSTSSNFSYFESSVYETRVYNSQGQLETSRKESFRSNIPGLVERQQQRQQQQEEASSTSTLSASPTKDTNPQFGRDRILSESRSADFEEEMIRDMERMLRSQDIILDNFLR